MIKYKKNGFAITALLYGLSIMALMVVALMMSVMQNSRKNSSTLVRNIEEELNAFGETTQVYTGGTPDYYVPEGQTGYFKIELQKGTNLVTGTIFLVEGTKLKVDLSSATASVKVDEGTLTTIMSTDGFLLGSAKNATTANRNKHQIINGQRITNTANQTKFKATKVAEVAPVTNNIYDGVTKITASNASKIVAVSFNPNKTAESNPINSVWSASGSSLNVSGSLSEIYVEYGSNVSNPTITLTRNVAPTSVTISPSGNTFKNGGYTLSRFGPTNTASSGEPKNGNYYFSLVSKSSNVFTLDQRNTLSTTTYTPPTKSDATSAANQGIKLIHYGSYSYGRPVANTNYVGTNSQKWRVEAIGSGKYKIAEIEEYKPFEVHKQDSTFDSVEPDGPGPILICGAYAYIPQDSNNWTSTDTYTGNPNQMWTFEAAGLGTYYLKTNHHVPGARYLYYDTTTTGKNRYHVTNTKSKASLFQLTNADL